MADLDVARTFAGKHLLMTGVTGFVGKSFLAWMMTHHPDVRRITCIVRPKAKKKPIERVHEVLQSEPLEVVRDQLGAALQGWVAEKLDAVAGDLAKPMVGLSEADVARLKGDVDVLVNVAAQVDFTPPLNDALTTNVEGALGALDLARTLGVPLAHVSTCFVAGYAKGFVQEEIVPDVCPNPDIASFDPEKELELCRRLVRRIQEDREDPTMPPPRRRLRTEGETRSRALGWPNTYTYTKALAEKLIKRRAAAGPGSPVRFTIVRPAIVESAWKFPLPGWSEGGNGSAGCILMAYVGQRWTPGKRDLVLDLVPVDLVAKGLALAVAALLNGKHREVYQLGTSDLNPLPMHRITELVNVWRHTQAEEEDRPLAQRLWLQTSDAIPGAMDLYKATSAPTISKVAGKVSGWLKGAPVPPGGQLGRVVDRAKAVAEAVERTSKGVEAVYDVYQPFIHDVDVRYKTRAVVETVRLLSPEEQAIYAYDADAMDWYQYFQDIHLPGLQKWIFPEMLRKLRQGITPDPATVPPIPGDLVDLLERVTADHGHRPFLRKVGEGAPQTLTYAQVRERAIGVARRLVARGVVPGDRVLMVVERGPEWALSYFGTLYAGATAVPVDPASPVDTLHRLAERSQARAWIVSGALVRKHASVFPADKTVLAEDVCQAPEDHLPALPAVPRPPDRAASILFTSGTTGVPRGVVLTHQNFLAVLRGIHGVYGLGPDDRFLSVLPLHHSFEFTAGLLFPLSRGASITYPHKITADTLGETLKEVRPTAMVGVPAVWSLLGRRIAQGIDDLPAPVRKAMKGLARVSGDLRDDWGLNLGPLLFFAVHRGLGGSLRHLVSGGAALPEGVLKDFYRWGFSLTSGYGLTEAAPVLTVAPPGTKRGDTVGPAITGVDVKIVDAGPDGVGEVVARGPNVMQGYLDDPEGTGAVLKGGWLYTGDLGRIDEDGNLVLVGRKKEVIVSANGENVYPDELEDRLYDMEGVDEVGVLGMPDGQGGEKVVVVVVPKPDGDERSIRGEVGERVAMLPASWRPQEVRFREEKLPRTASLKVSRARLRDEIAKEPPPTQPEPVEPIVVPETGRWLVDAMARAAGVAASEVTPSTRIGEQLPLDSLAWMDLVALIERRQGTCPPVDDLASMATVGDVVEAVLGRTTRRNVPRVPLFYGADGKATEAPGATKGVPVPRLPEGVQKPASALVRRLHATVSGTLFDIDVTGQAHLPEDRPVLVVANHSSHVDSGVLRHALGKLGDDLPLLAAQDYFFGTPIKDLLFGDLLDLVPADRHKTGLAGVRQALRILESGRSLAIFPEGTRSRDGVLMEFKPGAVLIALQAKVDVLPVHIGGTHDILPAGSSLPRGRSARVRIGRPIPWALLEQRVRSGGWSMQDAADRLRDSLVSLSRGGDSMEPWTESLRGVS